VPRVPALDGIVAKLGDGALVADVGCGHGASTLIMAEAYPRSRFVGFDYHAESVAHATAAAVQAGLADRVRFKVAPAKEFPSDPTHPYDLVCMFDCLRDIGDPVGAAAHVFSLKESVGSRANVAAWPLLWKPSRAARSRAWPAG
jgi:ubiquinone/menaquinone biosynthesis C-methylase UbiE